MGPDVDVRHDAAAGKLPSRRVLETLVEETGRPPASPEVDVTRRLVSGPQARSRARARA